MSAPDMRDRAREMGRTSTTRTPDWRQVFAVLAVPHQGHGLASALINAYEAGYDETH